MKSFITFTALFSISCLCSLPCFAQLGADRDEHGCIPSAGYTWSEVQKDCIRLFEKGIRTEATDGSQHSAYIVFSPDSSQVKLFFSDRKQTEILERRKLPKGGYAWNIEDDDTKNVRCENGLWTISQRGKQIYAQKYSAQKVTIDGTVTDYEGNPLDSVTVMWQSPSFDEMVKTQTDARGYFKAIVPKGKYQSMIAVNTNRYPHTAPAGMADKDKRLEFWGWDFIADRDTTLQLHYHRMEVYGLRVFRIPGAIPAYQIYVRPMSLTRTLEWMKDTQGKDVIRGKKLESKDNLATTKEAKSMLLAPPTDQLKATVWIDGEEVPVLMKQEIKEYIKADQWQNAYLLTVNMPQNVTANPYRIFKVELTDLENGDRGEGIYYMEKETYKQ